MKFSEIEKGIHVIIDKNPVNTARTHTVNASMRDMTGKRYIISNINATPHGLSAVIKGWDWHPKDLTEAVPIIKKSKRFHFNVKELVI